MHRRIGEFHLSRSNHPASAFFFITLRPPVPLLVVMSCSDSAGSTGSVASAAHRLSSYAVAEIGRRTPATIMQLVRSEVDALRAQMDDRGVRASTFIWQASPAGVYDGSVFCVVDRKAAYRYQLEHMKECPAAQSVFSRPKKMLMEWSAASENDRLSSGVRADVELLLGDGVPAEERARRLKSWYKMAYGKLCNGKKADKRMPAEIVDRLKTVGELVRRRNAVILMNHAEAMQQSFMAAFTDSVLLKGVDPSSTALAMSAHGHGQVWEVECVAKLVVLAKINTHLFVLEDDTVLTRPHEMLTGELAHSGLSPKDLDRFRASLMEGFMSKDFAALRDIYDQIPATLEMANAAGELGEREPSVRRLLGHVLSIYHTGPSRKRKRGAAGVHYAKLSDAKQAQAAVVEPCLVVGEDRAGSKGLYRRWTLMREHELVQCVGKPCHMTFVGRNVAYRVVVDYDEPRALTDEEVEAFASHVKDFWQNRKSLCVSVQVLRTRTRREGDKAHAEHVIFVATDDESGKECLLLNPEEIPLALGGSNGLFDELIYKLGKSLRLAGCPKLHDSGAVDLLSTHLPVECEADWTPSAEEYAVWSPCVLANKRHILHCDVMPAHDTAAAKEVCPYLFPSELFFVDAFVRWIELLCEGNYACDQPKMFYWNKSAQNDPDCNSFILTVIFKSKVSKDKKFLDYSDFAKRVAVPWLKGCASSAGASSCKHHGSNHSYFVFKVDANPAYGQGELRGVNANTHHDKQKSPHGRGAYMAMDDVAKSRVVGEESAEEYETMVREERQSTLGVTLAKSKSLYDAEVRSVNVYRVRLALLRRHRAHQPGRVFPTEGRRDGWSEKRISSHEDTVIAVTSLVRWATKAVALRAVYTELKFYKTNFKGNRAALVVQRLEELRDACDNKQEVDELAEPWGAVVRYASNITYKNEVY